MLLDAADHQVADHLEKRGAVQGVVLDPLENTIGAPARMRTLAARARPGYILGSARKDDTRRYTLWLHPCATCASIAQRGIALGSSDGSATPTAARAHLARTDRFVERQLIEHDEPRIDDRYSLALPTTEFIREELRNLEPHSDEL